MNQFEEPKDPFSKLFLDYVQLWVNLPKGMVNDTLMLQLAQVFSGHEDGYYEPKAARLDTLHDRIYINHANRGIDIRINSAGARIQLSGSFFKQLSVKKQLVELREFIRTFYLLMENRKTEIREQSALIEYEHEIEMYPYHESEWYKNTSVSRLDLSKNVYRVKSWHLANMNYKCRSNMLKTFQYFQYDKGMTDALLDMYMEAELEQENAESQFSVYQKGDEVGWRAVSLGVRGKETIRMLIYDKRYDKNKRHDIKKFGTDQFYRWEYNVGRRVIRNAGIEDLAYLDFKNVINLWNICLRQYNPAWGDHKIPLKYMKNPPVSKVIPDDKKTPPPYYRLPTIFGHLKALDPRLFQCVVKGVELIQDRDRFHDVNGKNAYFEDQLKLLVQKEKEL